MTTIVNKNKKPVWLRWIFYIGIIAVVYFGNNAVNRYLGLKVINNTGLSLLSLDEAMRKAQQEDKLILADMSAIWCPNCRKLDKKVLSDSAVQAVIEQHYIFARIEYDSDEGKQFMAKYGVKGFPTVLVLDQNGKRLQQVPLTFDPQEFAALILRE